MAANKPAFHGITKSSMHNVGGGRRRGGTRGVSVYKNVVILKPGQRIVYRSSCPHSIVDAKGRTIRLFKEWALTARKKISRQGGNKPTSMSEEV